MSISAEPPTAAARLPVRLRSPAPRAAAGFTLMEVMVTLALVALTLLPLLELRQVSSNMAFKSGHMLRAMSYAQRVLAERMTDPETLKERAGVIEDDPLYRYEISIENFDLSTGRTQEETEAQQDGATNFKTESAFTPGDAGAPPEPWAENEAYLVRRVKVTLFYPSLEGEAEEKLALEGYLPRAVDPDADSLLKDA